MKLTTPSGAEVKDERSYTSAPHIWLHGVNGEDFIFYFLRNKEQ
jgi:hypothetical protein